MFTFACLLLLEKKDFLRTKNRVWNLTLAWNGQPNSILLYLWLLMSFRTPSLTFLTFLFTALPDTLSSWKCKYFRINTSICHYLFIHYRVPFQRTYKRLTKLSISIFKAYTQLYQISWSSTTSIQSMGIYFAHHPLLGFKLRTSPTMNLVRDNWCSRRLGF